MPNYCHKCYYCYSICSCYFLVQPFGLQCNSSTNRTRIHLGKDGEILSNHLTNHFSATLWVAVTNNPLEKLANEHLLRSNPSGCSAISPVFVLKWPREILGNFSARLIIFVQPLGLLAQD